MFRPSLGRLNRRGPIGDILAIAGRDRPPFPSGRYRGRPVLSGSWSILAHSTRRRASQIVCEPTDNHSNETSDRCPDDQGGSNCCDPTHTYPPEHPPSRGAFERLPDSSRRHQAVELSEQSQRRWLEDLPTCSPGYPSSDSTLAALRAPNYVKHNPMKTSTTNVKRKIGRPSEIGADKFVGLRLPGSLVHRVGTWAKQSNVVSRSKAIRLLIEKGLEK
jgi:hypothetical protein